jgi:hypothetical protein
MTMARSTIVDHVGSDERVQMNSDENELDGGDEILGSFGAHVLNSQVREYDAGHCGTLSGRCYFGRVHNQQRGPSGYNCRWTSACPVQQRDDSQGKPLPDSSKGLSRIAVGSCNSHKMPRPHWDTLTQIYQPDLFILAGDNVNGDCIETTDFHW